MPKRILQSHAGRFLLWLTVLSLAAPAASSASEQAEQFVEALRRQGWHDTALEYLATAADDPIASPEFVESLGYHRAQTLASNAKLVRNEKQRLQLSQSAIAAYLDFSEAKSDSPFRTDALQEAGNLLAQQALYRVAKAKKLPAEAKPGRERLFQEARERFDQAASTAAQVLESCDQQLKALPKAAAANRNSKSGPLRQQLRAQQAESRFFIAKLGFETAQTYAKGSKKYREALDAASESFSKLYADYMEKLVGFYGRLYEGRCYQEAGEFEKALHCYDDLIDQPIGHPDFRRLVARAYRRRAECQLAQGKPDLVIRECQRTLSDTRGELRRQPEWLAVAFRLAEAYAQKAKPLAAGSSDAKRLRSQARQLLRDVARDPGEFQGDARLMLVSLGSSGATKTVVSSFTDALAAGKSSLDAMNSTKLAAKLAKNNNPAAVESLESQARQSKQSALQYFQQALRLTDDRTSPSELNAVRYFLCWLYWEDGRIEEAAVMGEFLARRYPESDHAPVAAKVALAAYERLYNDAKTAGAPGRFEASRLAELAELIASHWSGSPEASTAVGLLIKIAIREDRISDAEALLARLPKQGRSDAAASLGSGIWTRYLQLAARGEAGEEELIGLRGRAAALLAQAFESISTGSEPSQAEATAVLYFVQLLLAEGKAGRAVDVLEHSRVGPLTLLRQRDGAVASPKFAVETYKAALRAYVSVVPPQRDNAQRMMDVLEKSAGTGKGAQKKLISIYVSLGRQLQMQVKELTEQGQKAKARAVADSFGDLLERVISQGGGGDWATSSWIAQTNLQLGQGLSGHDAENYLRRAEKAYRQILASVEEDPEFAPSELAILATRKRLADCLRDLGQFGKAFDQYREILAKNPTVFELQHAAATTLQQWGAIEKDVEKLEQAIRGGLPQANNKNLVWGWLRLAAVADYARKKTEQSSADESTRKRIAAKHLDLFFDSRYNAAKARFLAANSGAKSARAKHLQRARSSVVSMQQLYPEMGGPKWKHAFEALKQEIEKAQPGKDK